MDAVKAYWPESRAYRLALIAALVYFVFRLAIQLYFFSDALRPQAVAEGVQVSADLQQSYIASARHFQAREDLYIKGSLEHVEAHYLYSPAFAFAFSPILLLPLNILLPLLTIIHIAAYAWLFILWAKIFDESKLTSVSKIWAGLLPLFLVFSVFWDDLAYMNTYILIALCASLLIRAILKENLVQAIFWLGVVILPIKPHWAFALVLPLLLARYRFLIRLIAGSVIAYLIVAAITIAAGGMDYGFRQYSDYLWFLARLSRDYPWWGPDKPFLGYNHSIMQIVVYSLGVSAENMRLASTVKLILLIPLAWVGVKFLRNPINKAGHKVPETALALAFGLYLGAFIWLDMVWELSLGLVIFAFLLPGVEQKWARTLMWIFVAPYALLDIWRLVSYLALGDSILYQDSYVLTDPLIYVPWIMTVLLIFYTLTLQKLARLLSRLA